MSLGATYLARHRAHCHDSACPWCEHEAEAREYDRDPAVDDWQKAQDQYERYLDRLGGDQ